MKILILTILLLTSSFAFAESVECENESLNINIIIDVTVTDFPKAEVMIDLIVEEEQSKYELTGFFKTVYDFGNNKTYNGYNMPLNGDPLATKEFISYSFSTNDEIGRGIIDLKEFGFEYVRLTCTKI